MALGIDCKPMHGACNKSGCLPEERGVVLDCTGVRAYLEQVGDVMRWIPAYHMLVDRLAKHISSARLNTSVRYMLYAPKYNGVIKKHTKLTFPNTRKALLFINKRTQGNHTQLEQATHVCECMRFPCETTQHTYVKINDRDVRCLLGNLL